MSDVFLYGLGSRTRVTVAGTRAAELHDAVRHVWGRCLSPDAPGAGELETEVVETACDEAEPTASDPEGSATAQTRADAQLAGVLQSLTQEMTRAKIQAQAGRVLMFHAGAVADLSSGGAVAFVAPGGTGKTTLMRRLGNRYGYVTDETVAVDADRRVYPYAKPLSIRVPGQDHKDETSPDDLHLKRTPHEPWLRRIVLLGRDDTHDGQPQVEELARHDALAALTPETSSLASLPRPLHWFDDLLAGLEPTVRLRYREVDTVLDLLADMIGAP